MPELELGDLSRCSLGLASRDLGGEAKSRVKPAFKQDKVNGGPGEREIPTQSEIRVDGES